MLILSQHSATSVNERLEVAVSDRFDAWRDERRETLERRGSGEVATLA
jgi:hypothetical protein